MRSKIFASLLLFIIFTQTFSLVNWATNALEYAQGKSSSSICLMMMDEEMEEEGIKIPPSNYLAENHLQHNCLLFLINKEVQYLHQSEELKEGFMSIPYNPPNC